MYFKSESAHYFPGWLNNAELKSEYFKNKITIQPKVIHIVDKASYKYWFSVTFLGMAFAMNYVGIIICNSNVNVLDVNIFICSCNKYLLYIHIY